MFSSLPTLRHPREAARAEFFEFVLEAKLPKFENVFLVPSGKICRESRPEVIYGGQGINH